MSWRDLEAAAPDLAREGWSRFERTKVAMLGTIREDGSPRISPVQPYLIAGELVVGVMPSPKLDDLRRDPRCVLHSSVSDLDGSEGEFKIHGRVVSTEEGAILEAEGTWWFGRPRDRFEAFTIDVDEAILVTWDTGQDTMRSSRWAAAPGLRRSERDYP